MDSLQTLHSNMSDVADKIYVNNNTNNLRSKLCFLVISFYRACKPFTGGTLKFENTT